MDFAEKIAELEKILQDMDGEKLSLDRALEEYERGIKLIRECRAYLSEAQQKVTMLAEEDEKNMEGPASDE
ncbi:MAG: exodeoxyribonuclease VII small subunit [Synergistes sp.]|nr:exodeoxyribonuclease VII small subunit [Synergistes sp.]MCR5336578.1 exodeoxyribonuclease VII small subunit [Synergistes sp.]